jgi:hypothetical protein
LTSYGLFVADPGDGPHAPALSELAAAVARAKRDYQACQYSIVLGVLPGLLETAHLACATASGDELLTVYGLAADAYQVTGSVMLKLGDAGLAAVAADRSMDAATRSENPVVIAASVRIVTHSLMRGGHALRAKELTTRAAERLVVDLRKPDAEAISVYGALAPRGAIAAATNEDRNDAMGLLDEAGDAARRLGRDDNMHWTAFGPTNVAQHRVHVAMVLGDAGTAVDLARRVDLSQIPIAERKAALFIDTAQALAQWGKHERAYRALRMADQVAPEELRTKQSVHRLVGELASRALLGVRSQVREFAQEIGVPM